MLDILREEGIWELIFSEKFFYFGTTPKELNVEIATSSDGVLSVSNLSAWPENHSDLAKAAEVDILQVEAISFLEFIASLNENKNNLVITF